MLDENSDEPYCEEIAEAIVKEIRRGNRIDTTTKLRQVIEKTLEFLPEKERKDTVKKTCQRVFQALRIDVNREFEVLYEFMEKLPGALKPGANPHGFPNDFESFASAIPPHRLIFNFGTLVPVSGDWRDVQEGCKKSRSDKPSKPNVHS